MSVATAYATWVQGAQGHLIEVQADVSSGVVGTTVVGRAARNAGSESATATPGAKRTGAASGAKVTP